MKGRMWPIEGGSKAKRISWGPDQNHISWAFMKQMRERDNTKKIYDCDPYVEVYQFRDNLYGLFNQNCDGFGDVFQYLIVGPEKCLLIDTACGLGDLNALLGELTEGKPVIVVNTHGHPDHSYGNCRFDKIYCHEYDVPMLKSQNEHIWDYLFDENGNNIWLQFDKEDLPTWKEYGIIPISDGHTFDLGGGYEVELVWLGGHSPGMSALLDKRNRIVFMGDDLCSDLSNVASGGRPGSPNRQYMNMTTFRDNLTRLVARMDEYDYLFPSHCIINLENSLLQDQLDACNAVLADPDCYDSITDKGTAQERRYKYISGFSLMAYTLVGLAPIKSNGMKSRG